MKPFRLLICLSIGLIGFCPSICLADYCAHVRWAEAIPLSWSWSLARGDTGSTVMQLRSGEIDYCTPSYPGTWILQYNYGMSERYRQTKTAGTSTTLNFDLHLNSAPRIAATKGTNSTGTNVIRILFSQYNAPCERIRIYRNTSSNFSTATQIYESGVMDISYYIYDRSALSNTLYHYWIYGANALHQSPAGYAYGYLGSIYPPAPSQLVATDGRFTTRISLSWAVVTNASSYEVWRGTNASSSSSTRLATVGVVTNYDDYSAVNGRLYFYWVKSKNDNGAGDFSVVDTGYAGARPTIEDLSRPYSVRLNQSNGFTVIGLEPLSTVTIQSVRSLDEASGNSWLDVGNVVVTNFITLSQTNLIASTNQTGFFRLVGTPDTNLTQNLVAYYPLNGDADDISGNENNGIVHGTPRLAANRFGKEGSALYFNGDGTSYIDTGVALQLTNAPISVSLWIRFDVSAGRVAFGAWSPVSLTWGDFLVFRNNTDTLSFRTFGGTSALATSPVVSTGKWIHVVAVAKSPAPYIHRMYVDTVPYDGLQEGKASSRTNLFIGGGNRMGANTSPWIGSIDDVRIYNRVLTSNDVWKLFNLRE